MAIHVLGIRHHGVGSARKVQEYLEEVQPDIILLEGAPETDAVMQYIGHEDLVPPVAIMLYDEKDLSRSTFYPYLEFSPEWVGASYANKNNIPLRSIDLPAAVSLNVDFRKGKPVKKSPQNETALAGINEEEVFPIDSIPVRDPIGQLGAIAGFASGESWWEYQFEQHDSLAAEHFEAVMLAMSALRSENVITRLDAYNVYREAYMRQCIRTAINDMYENIVIICGAWHAPRLQDVESSYKDDKTLLKQIPKISSKISTSWIPWTNGRLSMHSGYGAGIQSPGWYQHLWNETAQIEIKWLSKVADLFRKKGMDISSAHVIESYNLSHALALLRDKHRVTMDELNESVLTVMCMGDGILLELIKSDLIVGDVIGQVPEDIPKVPLQKDFEQTIKSLRLKLSAAPKHLDLDLRKKPDLKKSILFHRLAILNISWAEPRVSRSKGSFKESWTLIWAPDMMLSIIDKAYLGNTLEIAVTNAVLKALKEEKSISALVGLLQKTLPASLDQTITAMLNKIDDLSSISSDVLDIMSALPPLIRIKRYGDVRKTDVDFIDNIVHRLGVKVCINLPTACYGVDESNSSIIFEQISALTQAFKINADEDLLEHWYLTLLALADEDGVHPIIAACGCRGLLDADKIDKEEASRRMSFALSSGHEPTEVASWIEGFLRGNGLILVYDDALWNIIYQWIDTLEERAFMEILPYMRRAFSKFEYGERKQIGMKAKQGRTTIKMEAQQEAVYDAEQTAPILKTIQYLMGI